MVLVEEWNFCSLFLLPSQYLILVLCLRLLLSWRYMIILSNYFRQHFFSLKQQYCTNVNLDEPNTCKKTSLLVLWIILFPVTLMFALIGFVVGIWMDICKSMHNPKGFLLLFSSFVLFIWLLFLQLVHLYGWSHADAAAPDARWVSKRQPFTIANAAGKIVVIIFHYASKGVRLSRYWVGGFLCWIASLLCGLCL